MSEIDFSCKVFFGAILCGKLRSNGKIVSGQILGKYNKSFAKWRQNRRMLHKFIFLHLGAPSDAKGPPTKSGAPRVLKSFFLVFLSQCRVGVVIRNHNYWVTVSTYFSFFQIILIWKNWLILMLVYRTEHFAPNKLLNV